MRAAAILLVLALLLAMAGCGGPPAPVEEPAPTPGGESPLVISCGPCEGTFHPLLAETEADRLAAGLTAAPLLTVDRSGAVVYHAIQGETRSYQGTEETYTGLADLEVAYDRTAEVTRYTWTLREDARFSDGVPLTADDVIFTYYTVLDPSYEGPCPAAQAKILGLEEYRTGEKGVSRIEGIRKLSETQVEIRTRGFDAAAVYLLGLESIAPLHWDGNPDQYDEEEGRFGFDRGDLSRMEEKSGTPLGAGPYRLVERQDGVVYFEANEHYWKGTPATRFLQLRETASEKERLEQVRTGTADLAVLPAGGKAARIPAEGNLTRVEWVEEAAYGYIGLNAETVCVGGDPAGAESKALRRGLTALLGAFREESVRAYYGDGAAVAESLYPEGFWAAEPAAGLKENKDAALETCVEELKRAGYRYDEAAGRFTAPPEGAKLGYEVLLAGSGTGDHPLAALCREAGKTLEKIGLTLRIRDLPEEEFWLALESGEQELWCAAWETAVEPDLWGPYGSTSGWNYYRIRDPELDRMITAARETQDPDRRRAAYRKSLERVRDWAVELPAYRCRAAVVFSGRRLDPSSVEGNLTAYYSWLRGVDRLRIS